MRRLLNDPRVVSLLVVIALFVVAWRWYAYLNPRRPTARIKPPPAVAGEKVPPQAPAPPTPATPPGPALPAGEAGPPPAAIPEGPPAPTIQKLSLPIYDLVVTDRDPFSVVPPTPLEEGFPVEPRIPPPPPGGPGGPGGPSPSQQPSSPPLPPLPDIRLKMVMFADGTKKAVVELDGAEWILEEGDKFGKEQVASIEEEAIVLTSTTYGVRAIRLPGMVFEAQGRPETRSPLTPSRTPTATPSFPRPVEKEIQPPEVAEQEMPQEGVGRE